VSRPFRLHWASASALSLFVALPAAAAVRTARFEWTPAVGAVAGYAVFASVDGGSEELYARVSVPTAEIEVDSGASLRVSVAAFDATGTLGPRSDASPGLRLCPGDFDGNETIGGSDLLRVRTCIGQAAAGACAGADVDLDGLVTSADYASATLGSPACLPEGPCPGDFDGDGVIGSVDLYKLRKCVGLLPQGSCALADMDGNGFVGLTDVYIGLSAYGEVACSL
jgi:hypothetical protein